MMSIGHLSLSFFAKDNGPVFLALGNTNGFLLWQLNIAGIKIEQISWIQSAFLCTCEDDAQFWRVILTQGRLFMFMLSPRFWSDGGDLCGKDEWICSLLLPHVSASIFLLKGSNASSIPVPQHVGPWDTRVNFHCKFTFQLLFELSSRHHRRLDAQH